MKRILLPLLLCSVMAVSAQTVTIFDPYNATKQATVVDKPELFNNVQWNFSLLTRGAFAFTYERKINNYLGLEGGIGLTYLDPMSEIMMLDSYYYESKEYKGGFMLSGALKVYPKEMEDFEGVYASPIFRYRTYSVSTTVEEYDSGLGAYKTGILPQSLRATDMALLIGYQYEGDSGIMWNGYFGAGWTNKRYEDYTYNATIHDWEMDIVKMGTPNIFFGMSLGFTF